jgi:hypothetical protein
MVCISLVGLLILLVSIWPLIITCILHFIYVWKKRKTQHSKTVAPKKKLVVLTGAGISAESGIRTFRDSDGLWEGYDIYEVASPRGWAKDPKWFLIFITCAGKMLPKQHPMPRIPVWLNWKKILMYRSSPKILMTCMSAGEVQMFCTCMERSLK